MIDLVDCVNKTASLHQRLLLVLQSGTVKRFHTTPTLHENILAQHQWGVAILAYTLAHDKPSVNLLMSALTHDLAEKVYGDIPAPAKRALGLRETINDLEASFIRDKAGFFPLTAEELNIVKLADNLDGMLYCIHERILGNRWADTVYERFRGYVHTEQTLNEWQFLVVREVELLWEEATHGR